MERVIKLQSLPRIIKKAPECILTIKTSEGERYEFQYIPDDKLWRVLYELKPDAIPMENTMRNISKVMRRIEHVVEVVIR